MIVLNQKLLVIVLAILGTLCAAQKKTKCQVVKALRDQGVPDSELKDWLCLVDKESSYKYNAEHTNYKDGSVDSIDYGIFQLNDKYWCSDSGGYSGKICWRLNTYGCDDKCKTFKDSDISNDAYCAVRVKKCKGFEEWVGWRNKCKGKDLSSYDFSECKKV
ncbi:lysozyme-like [Mercenaria mercenaria]|uniref:lysozyme-like n=1 Tax=Mercenaria mercenaria TaxID=6596 RepID=UPI001E1DA1F2|nr:lysozyme-like [Mercenaria mercenaria]